jgi:thiosulfate dehydrogenase
MPADSKEMKAMVKLAKKPPDAPYPPYADNLSQQRHQYGPFQPVSAILQRKIGL